ncbi:MAG: NAD(P)-binding protein, partial [Pseudomonadota bacterium]
MRIAVIGSGISGNGAAFALSQAKDSFGKPLHDVVMYERRERAGGHAHTVQVDYDGRSIPV